MKNFNCAGNRRGTQVADKCAANIFAKSTSQDTSSVAADTLTETSADETSIDDTSTGEETSDSGTLVASFETTLVAKRPSRNLDRGCLASCCKYVVFVEVFSQPAATSSFEQIEKLRVARPSTSTS